jgi:hypothetical protein
VLTKFLLPFRMGGKLLAMGSWTRDGGTGPDDYAVFISTTGECIIYAEPIHPVRPHRRWLASIQSPNRSAGDVLSRPVAIWGFDLAGPCSSLAHSRDDARGSQARQLHRQDQRAIPRSVSNDRNAIRLAMPRIPEGKPCRYQRADCGANDAASVRDEHQHRGMVPIYRHQCRMLGASGDSLYFGGNGAVIYKYTGTQDGSSNITGIHQSAYTDLGTTRNKRFLRARPKFLAPTGYDPPITVQTDYDNSTPAVNTVAASSGGTQWDAGQWDTFQWAGGTVPSLRWQGVSGQGSAVSIAFGVSSGETLVYNGTDLGFEAGNWL